MRLLYGCWQTAIFNAYTQGLACSMFRALMHVCDCLQIKTSNAFLKGMLAILAVSTIALGPLAMFNLYFMPYWINVVWLDVVTYLHHHGPQDADEKIPWFRGEVGGPCLTCSLFVWPADVVTTLASSLAAFFCSYALGAGMVFQNVPGLLLVRRVGSQRHAQVWQDIASRQSQKAITVSAQE